MIMENKSRKKKKRHEAGNKKLPGEASQIRGGKHVEWFEIIMQATPDPANTQNVKSAWREPEKYTTMPERSYIGSVAAKLPLTSTKFNIWKVTFPIGK